MTLEIRYWIIYSILAWPVMLLIYSEWRYIWNRLQVYWKWILVYMIIGGILVNGLIPRQEWVGNEHYELYHPMMLSMGDDFILYTDSMTMVPMKWSRVILEESDDDITRIDFPICRVSIMYGYIEIMDRVDCRDIGVVLQRGKKI